MKQTEKCIQDNSPGFGCALLHILIPVLIFGGVQLYQHYFPKSREEIAREKDPNRKIYFEKFVSDDYHPELRDKVSRLDSVSKNLNEILYFVDFQRKSLEEQEKNLSELIKQNKELEPIVNSKKELVDAIFRVQEKRNEKDKVKDQLIGFVLGVISSLVASGIIFLWKKRFRPGKQTPLAQD